MDYDTQRAMARVVYAAIDSFVQSPAMKVDWIGRESVVDQLHLWLERQLLPTLAAAAHGITSKDLLDWKVIILERLARHRIKHLLDYVKSWPASTGAILDLKECMHSSELKILIATSFTQQLTRRLLHAGVTTSELLSIYINVIMAFKTLDPRGVLLDKVALPLRTYLRHRDDTVRIIAASFLADADDDSNANPDDVCYDLAREINLSEGQTVHADQNKGLDWDDMEWMPDPIDAGPDYKKSKSEDVMSFMLTLFEQSDFIKEVQSLLGERLLSAENSNAELEKEIRLVELFKTRFGADRLQSCEVMLRDIQDSKRINKTLRPQTKPNTSGDSPAILYTQILSSFFWPSLREDEFSVPEPIATLQKNFEQDFERVKNLRKLHWLSALGKATVEIELEDRTVKLEGVQTWQASVIYAFQNQEDTTSGPTSKSVQELEEALSMDEMLVRNALAFWVGHRVLVEDRPDVFTVLEKLPSADEEGTAPAPAQKQADAAISAVKSQDAVLQDNKPMYEMFMMGMLMNGGAMDAARVTMMMKMVVPGGYNFGEDETRWLLAGLAEQGKVVANGSSYSIKK